MACRWVLIIITFQFLQNIKKTWELDYCYVLALHSAETNLRKKPKNLHANLALIVIEISAVIRRDGLDRLG